MRRRKSGARRMSAATPAVLVLLHHLLDQYKRAKYETVAPQLGLSAPILRRLAGGSAIQSTNYLTAVEKLATIFPEDFDPTLARLEAHETDEAHLGHADPVAIEAVADGLRFGPDRLWDLDVPLFHDRAAHSAKFAGVFEAIERRVDDLLHLNDARKLAVAQFMGFVADLTYADPNLVLLRDRAIHLGLAVLTAPLISRVEDTARQASLLSSQLIRDVEGPLWAFAEVPTASAQEVEYVLEVYRRSNADLAKSAGGGATNKWQTQDRWRLHVNHVCEARTLLQGGKLPEAKRMLDKAQEVSGKASPLVSLYRGHYFSKEFDIDAAIGELEVARQLYLRSADGPSNAAAVTARLFELTGGEEYRAGAKHALSNPGIVLKHRDVASFDEVARLAR
jgi:hypothetical protein